jgi:hypothetical protein
MRLPRKLKKKVKKQKEALRTMQLAVARGYAKSQLAQIIAQRLDVPTPVAVALKASSVAQVMVDFKRQVDKIYAIR